MTLKDAVMIIIEEAAEAVKTLINVLYNWLDKKQ